MLQILRCPEGCLNAVGDVDLFENIIKMGLHRVGADAKFVANFLIRSTYGHQGKYLALSQSKDRSAAVRIFCTTTAIKDTFGHCLPRYPQFSFKNSSDAFQPNI